MIDPLCKKSIEEIWMPFPENYPKLTRTSSINPETDRDAYQRNPKLSEQTVIRELKKCEKVKQNIRP